MKLSDLEVVVSIENAGHLHPWSEGIFRDCLDVGYDCQVFELAGEVVGYSVMSYAPAEAHLLNICVAPARQGQGLGRQMLEMLLDRARRQHADTLFLEVRVSNRAAQRLYEKAGFNEVGRRFDYYPAEKGREDALVLAKAL